MESHTHPGWWVSKTKDIQISNKTEHSTYALRYLGIKDPGFGGGYSERTDKILIATIKKGWIRIRNYDYFLAVTLPKIKDFDILCSWVIKHKEEFQKSFLVQIDKVPYNYIDTSFDWFLSTGGVRTTISEIINNPNAVFNKLINRF